MTSPTRPENEQIPQPDLQEIERRLAARTPEENNARQARLDAWLLGRDAMTTGERHLVAGELETRPQVAVAGSGLPRDIHLHLVFEAAQLYEDFQAVLPEIREGRFWRLLRADYALSEGSVFGAALSLQLPAGRKSVVRHVGLTRRRFEASAAERPRVMLNREHQLITTLEAYLEKSPGADVDSIRDWFDRFCIAILDEKSLRAANAVLPKLYDQLTAITGADLIRTSAAELKAS
jgi:hypothetical protein